MKWIYKINLDVLFLPQTFLTFCFKTNCFMYSYPPSFSKRLRQNTGVEMAFLKHRQLRPHRSEHPLGTKSRLAPEAPSCLGETQEKWQRAQMQTEMGLQSVQFFQQLQMNGLVKSWKVSSFKILIKYWEIAPTYRMLSLLYQTRSPPSSDLVKNKTLSCVWIWGNC